MEIGLHEAAGIACTIFTVIGMKVCEMGVLAVDPGCPGWRLAFLQVHTTNLILVGPSLAN